MCIIECDHTCYCTRWSSWGRRSDYDTRTWLICKQSIYISYLNRVIFKFRFTVLIFMRLTSASRLINRYGGEAYQGSRWLWVYCYRINLNKQKQLTPWDTKWSFWAYWDGQRGRSHVNLQIDAHDGCVEGASNYGRSDNNFFKCCHAVSFNQINLQSCTWLHWEGNGMKEIGKCSSDAQYMYVHRLCMRDNYYTNDNELHTPIKCFLSHTIEKYLLPIVSVELALINDHAIIKPAYVWVRMHTLGVLLMCIRLKIFICYTVF